MTDDVQPTPSEIVLCNATAFADVRHRQGVRVPGTTLDVDRFQVERSLLLAAAIASHATGRILLAHSESTAMFGFLRRHSLTISVGTSGDAWPVHTLEGALAAATRETLAGRDACPFEQVLATTLARAGRAVVDTVRAGAIVRGIIVPRGPELAAIAESLRGAVDMAAASRIAQLYFEFRSEQPHVALALRRAIEVALRMPVARRLRPPSTLQNDAEEAVDLDDWRDLNRNPPSATRRSRS